MYPRSASAAVKALFRDHDVAFAAALGVPLHRPEKGGAAYKIELIVASEWWDDGVYEEVKKKRARQRVS